MPTKKLVISTYFQYILIALGALLVFTFVPQIGGVLLTFLLAAILAYVLNPLVRRLEGWRIPRVVAVIGVFMALLLAILAATALYGVVGAVFAVPIVAITASASRYLRGALLFERWHKAPVFPAPLEERER